MPEIFEEFTSTAKIINRALSASSLRSIFARAKRFYNSGTGIDDYRSGFGLLKQAASLGLVAAHEWLGAMYDYGLGTRRNRKLSLKHYLIAALAGLSNGEYHVRVFYYEGVAVQKNYRTAVSWLQKASDHNDTVATYWLGQCYLHGRGVRRDRQKGFALELDAAKRMVVEAQYSVALCYQKGQGIKADASEAFKWYLKAAKRGYKEAANNLGYLYETGFGVKANRRKAEFWYKRSDVVGPRLRRPSRNKLQ